MQASPQRAGNTRSLIFVPLWATALSGLLAGNTTAHADVAQVWYQSTLFYRLDERWSVGNYVDLRVTDGIGDLATVMLSPRLRLDLSPQWSAQLNTTWMDAQSANQRSRTEFTRLEFELNPRYVLGKSLVFSARNRFELRWIEGQDGINERLRLRPQLDLQLSPGGIVRGIFANNEVFYDFETRTVTENRLTPWGLVFRPTAAAEVRLYQLWRHTRQANKWYDFHVLGVLLNWNLE